MEQHIKVLGILNLVYASLGVLGALAILLIFGGVTGLILADEQDPEAAFAAPFVGSVGLVAFIFVAIFTAPPLVAGIGLLKFKTWARPWTIVASVLNILSIPFGTALGIYGLWVMFKDETMALIRAKNAAGAA